jgi:hypothetical protein
MILIINKEKIKKPVSPVADLLIIDQSFLALFICGSLPLTSAKISSLSTGLVFFLIGRFARKSSLSSSNGKIEDFVVAFG